MGDRGGKTTTGLVIDLQKIPLVLVIYTCICKKQTIGRTSLVIVQDLKKPVVCFFYIN